MALHLQSTLAKAAVVALCALAAGCSRGPDEKAVAAQTQALIAKHDYKAAAISAKGALQDLPESAELRRLLGLALLESGDAVAAAVELRKARDLGASEIATAPALARALLGQRETRQVLTQFAAQRLDDAAASADLRTTVGTAHAMLGDRTAAAEAAAAALKEWPQHAGAKLLQARLAAGDGDTARAMTLVDQVLAAEPQHLHALLLRGDLERAARDDTKALESFRAAAAARPDSAAPPIAIATVLLDQGKLEDAGAELAKLKKIAPGHPETRMLETRHAYQSKDWTRTRDLAAAMLKAMPEHPLLLVMAGEAELRLNSLGAAENYLGLALKAAPKTLPPRLLLAQLYLRTGQTHRTLEVLQPILAAQTPHAPSLALAGQAYLQQGDLAKSEAMFAKAAKADPKNTMARTALALNKLGKGQADTAFAELEAAAAGDGGARADLALIAARLRSRDMPGALRAIETLEKKQPKSPLPHVLRGRVLAAQKDNAGAAAAFERALALDPKYHAATASLVALDVAAGKPDEARARFEAQLKTDPKNHRALLGLAELKARGGGTKDEVVKLLGDAIRVAPSDVASRVTLVGYLQQQQDTKGALAAAQDAHAALPSNTDLLRLLGITQMSAAQPRQAVGTFTKLAAALPTRADVELLLADAHVANTDLDAAGRSLERALVLQPGLPAAKLGLARLALLQKKPEDAIKRARALQAEQPKMASAYMVEADAELARGNAAAAVAPLRTALPLAQGPGAAMLLHRTLVGLGRADEADRSVADWRKAHPNDASFTYYLGDLALAKRDWAGAEAHYRIVLQTQPEHALALNNIAWLMTQQSKPGAVALAEKANKLLPDRPALMDTLALALASDNQVPRAIELQKKAITIAPDNPNLRLTLARIYLKGGDRTRARPELEDLARLGNRFPAQDEVAELMKAAAP